MRLHNIKACWNQQRHKIIKPFSSSRQTSPIQSTVQQGQVQNYGKQNNKQSLTATTQAELSRQLRGSKQTQSNEQEISLWEEYVPQHQIQHQKILNRNPMSTEEINLQEQV